MPKVCEISTGEPRFGISRLKLAPDGREIDGEAAYARPVGSGFLSLNSFWRKEAGNIAAAPDDIGAAVRFTLGL